MVLRGATSLLRALEGVGPENFDFFGPKKVSGSPLPMPLVMMLHPSKPLRTAPIGTLIVIIGRIFVQLSLCS